jgi:hypothetical protein
MFIEPEGSIFSGSAVMESRADPWAGKGAAALPDWRAPYGRENLFFLLLHEATQHAETAERNCKEHYSRPSVRD